MFGDVAQYSICISAMTIGQENHVVCTLLETFLVDLAVLYVTDDAIAKLCVTSNREKKRSKFQSHTRHTRL